MAKDEEKYLIVKEPRDCPNCKQPTNSVENCDYDCPKCKIEFCSICAEKDFDGPGNYVFCPSCNEKLFFPKELQSHI